MHLGQSVLRTALCLFCLIASGEPLEAQADFNIRLWQSEDGLPNNIVQAIAQTHDGYLWIGTREGLARFDGVQFHPVDLLSRAAQPSVICLFGSRDGSLWIGTEQSGIFHLNSGKLERCDLKGGDGNFSVYEIQEAGDGVIWFGTSHGLFYWLNGKMEQKKGFMNLEQRFCTDNIGRVWVLDNGLKRLDSNTATNYSLQSGKLPNGVRAFYCDKNGTFWFGTDIGSDNALLRLKDGVVTRFVRGGGPAGFSSVIFRDSLDELWIGSYSGLCQFRNEEFFNFRTSDTSSYRIYSVFEDTEQNLWIGSEEGLTRLTPKRFKTITKKDGLSLNAVVSVCPSRDGGVWISSWGGGVNHYLDGKFTYLKTTNGLKSNYIMGILETRDGSFWAGSDYGGPLQCVRDGQVVSYNHAQGFDAEAATVVLNENSNGTLWIGNRGGLQTWNGTNFTRFTPKDGLYNNIINAICEGTKEEVWIGTDGGLMRWSGAKLENFGAKDARLKVPIFSLYEDAAGTLWIGSKGHGLLMLRDGAVQEFSSTNGLFSEFIYSILEDNHTNLWFNSSRGIFRVYKQQIESVAEGKDEAITSISYGKADGILASGQFRDVTQPAACKDTQGRLWFRTTQGVVVVDPDVIAVNHQPPPVVIQEVIADNKPMIIENGGQKNREFLAIPPGRGELEIKYAALSFTAPEKILYRYKLEGVDSDWVNAGNLRVTKYNNLQPGQYRFQVAACNNDGVWNEKGQSVELTLEPHFWQTRWFFASCGILAVAIVGGTARYATRRRMQKKLTQIEKQRAVEQERTRIARDVHDELGAKLTQISFQGGIATCSLNDPVETRKQIEQMSASAREAVSSLHEIIWAADPQNDSVEGLLAHISQHAEEFFNACAIRCEVVTPEHFPVLHISARIRHNLFLAVKEAINNTAKHAGATRVLIKIVIGAKALEILVSDDGGGFKIDPPIDGLPGAAKRIGHHGLVNMQERLKTIHGRCEIQSKEGQGTDIHFVIPLNDLTI
jgi:ligand-binding sensor domain-containing protein/signal transduction histidine kinase